MPWHSFPLFSIPSILFLSEDPEKWHLLWECPQAEITAHSLLCSHSAGGTLSSWTVFVIPWAVSWGFVLSTQEEPGLDNSDSWQGISSSYLFNWRQEDELGLGGESREKMENEKLMREKEVREEENQGGVKWGRKTGKKKSGRRRGRSEGK